VHVPLTGEEATVSAGSVQTEFVPDGFTKSVETLIKERGAARATKNYKEADRIRDELKAAGIILEDKDGKTTWRRA
jgi:cysteinyl-tRNA synthetase